MGTGTRSGCIHVEAWRGGRVESRHEVWWAAAGAQAPPAGAYPSTFMRSAAKPFQLVPLVAAGGAERLRLDAADLALMCASHDGTEAHAERVAAVLARMGLDAGHLRCGVHRPYCLDRVPPLAPARQRTYGPLHNNCSGNHAAMLALARECGADPSRYLDSDSPGQRRIHAVVEALSGVEPVLAVDDCGAPCYAMPVERMAEMYAYLAAPERLRQLADERRACLATVAPLEDVIEALARIAEAMACEPAWLSGEDTEAARLARLLPGRMVVKHGAEAILCVADRDRGDAVALKVADGNPRALWPAFASAAATLGWFDAGVHAALAAAARPGRFGRSGQRVGHLQARADG